MEATVAHSDLFPIQIIGGSLNGNYNRKYVIEHFHNGRYTHDCSKIREMGFICQRKELDHQPLINGYLGPMWDENSLRYEAPDVYRTLSF